MPGMSVLSHMSMPPSATPMAGAEACDHSGLTLRTRFRSRAMSAVAARRLIGVEPIVCAAGADAREGRLGRRDARQHGVVAALDARHVDEAGRAAEQRAAGEHQLRDRLPAALGDGARAIGDALAALERRRGWRDAS